LSQAKSSLFSRLRAQNDLIPFIGLLFLALDLIGSILYVTVTLRFIYFLVLIFTPFAVVFLVSAFGVMRHSRWGYILAVAITAVALLVFSDGGHGVEEFATPSNTFGFILNITFLPTLLATFLYSIVGLRRVWTGALPRPSPPISRSSIFAILTVGIIIGGLMVGLLAGTTISRLISSAGTAADITIVSTTQGFSPATFYAKVSQTVTWVNHDSIDHTVTSTNSTVYFDSKALPAGATFQFKFTAVGTYTYYCSIHTEMVGKVVVSP
jgi:plastocyanin